MFSFFLSLYVFFKKSGSSPSPARSALPLAVIIDGSHGRAEVVELGKVPGVEILAPTGGVHRLPPQLAEQHEHEAVDSHRRAGALIAHYLLSCANQVNDTYVQSINIDAYVLSARESHPIKSVR